MNQVNHAPSTLFSRTVCRPRPLWVSAVLWFLLLLIPVLALFLDGWWETSLQEGSLRPLLLPAVVTGYILLVSPYIARMDDKVLADFRPLAAGDPASFERLVQEKNLPHTSSELAAIGVGILVGEFFSRWWDLPNDLLWTKIYLALSMGALFGLLSWTIYESYITTRDTAALHRLPLKIDLFNLHPFETVGQESLLLALVFIGGITLSMVFGLDLGNLYQWQTWLVYLPMLMVPVLIFFQNMRPTHHLLSIEKNRQLELVRDHLGSRGRRVQECLESGEVDVDGIGEFNALTLYESRLRAVPTWPYNVGMLRTLVVSIFIPLVWKVLSTLLFG